MWRINGSFVAATDSIILYSARSATAGSMRAARRAGR
jgi:hypothetical protein